MRAVAKGATSQSVYFEVLDSTSTTGARKTGLAYNTASLTAYYVRAGGSATAITLATLAAANSAWSSGGFKEIDGTNMPGLYRLDVPDAAFATGADAVIVTLKGATGMVQASHEIQLTGANLQDTVRAGLTALPNVAAGASGGLPTGDASGRVTVGSNADKTGYTASTVSDKTGYALTAGEHTNIATDAQTGLTAQGYTTTRAGYLDTLNGLVAAVWAAGTRTLTSFGTLAADVWAVGTRTLTSGAAPSASTVASAVRTELTTELGRLDVAVSTRAAGGAGGLPGAGSLAYVHTVYRPDGITPIDGVAVWVSTDAAGLNVIAGTLTTDTSGHVTFQLDAGTYFLWRQLSGWNFTNPVTITVS